MSAVEKYQSAYRANTAAREAAAAKARVVVAISDGIRLHLRTFLGYNFDVRIDNRREPYERGGEIDFDEWPSPAELKSLFVTWGETDAAMRAAWQALSEYDRVGLSPPPRDMRLL
jgi:hypothetical protein